ncbi:alpha/beta fold hydrolase [Amycolatopsis sp. NPDC003731]
MRDLHPPIEPYAHGLLDVGAGHRVYWETCGNPDGKPAVVLHGGPGQGCSPGMRRMFDPARYRVVLLDQRGCGRSRPHAADPATSLRHNTTDHLVADLERLREHLGIERWLVTGGSWGATLALVYTERFPEAWQRFRDVAGDDDVVAAYARLLADPDRSGPPDDALLAFVRLTTHYYAHAGCPVTTAWELAAAWPGAELLVDDRSGHGASDVKRTWKLAALDRFAGQGRTATTVANSP